MPKTILVVEDASDIRQMMKFLLEMFGYFVQEAENGAEGIEKTTAISPDLILMDISMPVMDGLTATKIIRESKSSAVPIIAVTAFGKQYYERAIASGCNDLIAKPVDFDHLQAIINRYLTA